MQGRQPLRPARLDSNYKSIKSAQTTKKTNNFQGPSHLRSSHLCKVGTQSYKAPSAALWLLKAFLTLTPLLSIREYTQEKRQERFYFNYQIFITHLHVTHSPRDPAYFFFSSYKYATEDLMVGLSNPLPGVSHCALLLAVDSHQMLLTPSSPWLHCCESGSPVPSLGTQVSIMLQPSQFPAERAEGCSSPWKEKGTSL